MPLITCPSCLAKFESSGKAGTSCPTCGARLDGRSRRRPADDEDDRPSRRRSRRDDDEDDDDDYDDRPRRRGRTRPLVDNRSAETIKSGLVLWGIIGLVTLLVFGGLVVFVVAFMANQSEKMAERSRQQHAAATADAGPWNPNGGDPNMPGVDPAQLQIPGAQQPAGGFPPPGMPQPPGFPPQQGGQQPMFPPGMQPPGFGPAGGGSGNGPPGMPQPPGFPQQPGAQPPGFQPPGMPQPPGFQPPGMQPPGGFQPPGMPQPPGALGVPRPGGKAMPQAPAIPSAPGMPQGPGMPQPPGMQPGFGGGVATVELKNLRRVRGLGTSDELEVEFEYTAGAINPVFDRVVVKTANGTGDVNLAGFPQGKGKVRIKAFGRAKLTGKVEVWVERRNGVGPRATGQTISNTLTIE